MERSQLGPFLRPGLDILFVGLNPATGSSRRGHYFSVRPDCWNQLYESRLITTRVSMDNADITVFGSSRLNAHGWRYGMTDLLKRQFHQATVEVRSSAERECGYIARLFLQLAAQDGRAP